MIIEIDILGLIITPIMTLVLGFIIGTYYVLCRLGDRNK
jgi:hypothetical protein